MRILCRCGFLPIGPLWYCISCNTRRMSTELPTSLGWTRRLFLMTFRSSGRRHGPIGYVQGGRLQDSNIRMLTGTLKADWIQLPVERYLAALPTLKQGVIAGVFKIKGASLGPRSCRSRCSFPMTCLWMIGMQGSMPCPQCGLMCL